MREIKIYDPSSPKQKPISIEYRADRPSHTGGKKIEECEVDGVRMYLVDDERWFDADTYDRMFNPPKEKILKKGEKAPLKGLWMGTGLHVERGPNEKILKKKNPTKFNKKRKIA